MKPKSLWLLALGVSVLCGAAWWQWHEAQRLVWKIGVQTQAVQFASPQTPLFFWQASSVEDAPALEGLDLKALELNQQQRFLQASYTHLQSGLWLIELGTERVFLFTQAVELDPTLGVNFNSDWVVLAKSSLLPENWPVPEKGWVVLNAGTLSQKLKTLSLEGQKPIVRPVSGDTVWLQKLSNSDWQVLQPIQN